MSRRVLVTGGSRGLGRALCLGFAETGARVAFTFHDHDDDAEETRKLLVQAGCDPLVFRGDVADKAHATSTIAALKDEWGGLDVLVNNASLIQVLPIALLEEDDWDRVMDVNVKGAYLFTRAALRLMIRQRSGRVLSIGNFGIERVLDTPVHYAASKGALLAFSRALAREVGRYGITVNVLSPGLMETGLGQILPRHRVEQYLDQCGLSRLATTEEIAELAIFLTSEDSSFTTAAHVVADGGV